MQSMDVRDLFSFILNEVSDVSFWLEQIANAMNYIEEASASLFSVAKLQNFRMQAKKILLR